MSCFKISVDDMNTLLVFLIEFFVEIVVYSHAVIIKSTAREFTSG